MEKLKHNELKTIEEYKEYKRQKSREYYLAHAEEIRAKRRARYYNQKLTKQQEESKNK